MNASSNCYPILTPCHDPQVEVSELLVGDGCWGIDHEVDGFGGLGEGDDFAERGGAGEDHDDAVEAEGDAAVRGGAVFERVEEEAETGLRFLVGQAERAEDFCLHILPVDTDGA